MFLIDNNQVKILIVDDMRTNLKIVSDFLEGNHYCLYTADNVNTAFELIDKNLFDLILLDVLMPEMDGFEVCQRIKSREEYKDTPIIFLTGLTDPNSIVKSFECGAADFISKPINSMELLAKVKNHVDLKKTREMLEDKIKTLSKMNNEFAKNNSLLNAALEISNQLIGLHGLDNTLTNVLKIICCRGEVKDGCIYLNDWTLGNGAPFAYRKAATKNCIDENIPIEDEIMRFSYKEKGLMDIYEKLSKGNYVIVRDTDIKQKEVFKLFQMKDIFNVILIPIINEDLFIGFIAIANTDKERTITEFELKALEISAVNIGRSVIKEKQTAQLERLNKEIKDASESKTNFLANMSHEIRNPLNAILGIASILMDENLPLETKRYIEIIKNSGNSLSKIVNNVLDISKIEAGKIDLNSFPFDLRATVEEITSLFNSSQRNKNVVISYSIDDTLPKKLIGYGDGVHQVITNLVGNALKFTHKGFVCVKVKVENIHNDDVSITLSVEDSGIGIAPESIDKIFNSYTQANSTIKSVYKGTGLGLAISKAIIEFMGGALKVESELGKGSTFYFNLNLKKAGDDIETSNKEIVESVDKNDLRDKPPIRVLLAEDSLDNRLLIEAYLKKYNCILTTAENGEDALQKFRIDTFEVVLMDIQMPIKDGYTAIKEIREYEKQFGLSPVPVIALTSYAFKDEVERILNSGFTDHRSKPISKKTLIGLLDEYGGQSTESTSAKQQQLPVASVNIEWRSDWESGNDELDEQHRELLGMGNTLVHMFFSGKETESIKHQLEKFVEYLDKHFNLEEQILVNMGYPDYADHYKAHNKLVEKAFQLKQNFENGSIKPSEVFSFLLDEVIIGHLENEDKRFFVYTQKEYNRKM